MESVSLLLVLSIFEVLLLTLVQRIQVTLGCWIFIASQSLSMVLPKIGLCNVSLLISYWEWDETQRCFMNFMLLLLLLDNSLNISRLLKITAKKTNFRGMLQKLFICTDNAKSMRTRWKQMCVCINISGLFTPALDWARQLCSSHDGLVQDRENQLYCSD